MNRKKSRLLRLVPLLMTMAIVGAVAADGPIVATEGSFQCITHMTPVPCSAVIRVASPRMCCVPKTSRR